MGEKLDKIIEGYKPIPMKRMMYPRGMKLSEDFVNAFHREFDRLVDEGANPKITKGWFDCKCGAGKLGC